MSRSSGWAKLRQIFLLWMLIMVAMATWLAKSRSTDWNNPLYAAVYPINGDGSDAARDYIAKLDVDAFDKVSEFFDREASRYGHEIDRPVRFDLLNEVDELPPATPETGNVLSIMMWSLKTRYWAWRMHRGQDAIRPDIKIFLIYFDPDQHERLGHSVGLQKGLFGIVNAFASRRERGRNQVVIAHELLHTLGASDKYDLGTSLPLHPEGYAQPDLDPLYPQSKAEIMGGRIPISPSNAQMPNGLKSVIVGPQTAREINWVSK